MHGFEHAFETFFPIVFIIVFILVFGGMFFTIAMVFSPKLQGRMMARQMKALKHATDLGADAMGDAVANLGGAMADANERIYDEHGDQIERTSTRAAEAHEEAIRITARAVSDGLGLRDDRHSDTDRHHSQSTMYCKHCGKVIDADSKFCKFCGKEQ